MQGVYVILNKHAKIKLFILFLIGAVLMMTGTVRFLHAIKQKNDYFMLNSETSINENIPISDITPSLYSEPPASPTYEPTAPPTYEPINDPILTEKFINSEFFSESQKKGSIEIVSYKTTDYYNGTGEIFKKNMVVYLPYGYSEHTKYNVLFLMHVAGCEENFWLNHGWECNTSAGVKTVYAKNMLDNLIEKRFCEPIIVVCPRGYITDIARFEHNSDRDYFQFGTEFSEDILPFIAEHYSTFAEGTSRAELAAARNHFGFMGASFGAYMTFNSVLTPNFDLVSWYGYTGGGTMDPNRLTGSWSSKKFSDFPINLLYVAEGEFDDRGPVETSIYILKDSIDQFNDSNLIYTIFYGSGHDYTEWMNCLYNSAQLFFRNS